MPVKTAAEVFRDYEIDGNPASGAHKPVKSEIRDLLGAFQGVLLPTPRIIVLAGSIAATATDALIVFDLPAPGTVNVALPAVADRAGLLLRLVDWAGNATIVLTPNLTETIMGKTSPDRTWTMASSGGAGLGEKMELIPSTDLSGWLVSVG